MVNFKKTAKQFILTSVEGMVTKVLSIFLSNWLDKHMNHNLSNFIGLTVNASLDFIIMKRIFEDEEEHSTQLLLRYGTSVLAAMFASQIIFMITSYVVKKHYKKWYDKNWEKYVFWIRYVIGAIAYTFVEFPLHKLWVFKH